ncbi:surface antigen BspA-like [Trichomonas vaginalis G3]|uniref:Surface antigen BspA-like n=1 Tax=Trichomonas vaginalis (strain ATCC PRA-98 / G3) TaxID=412133 RepID=A2ED91_TRIV3|nr:surface antigen family [Trichomonas vaginalis G3]EAY09349.1 surface antigen BspA-like [Trichomonas vaginalis G3]KAI5501715.1 surface antigen family [Trichomonas vaginalis G3]|eukprot:XP_001321572.1 surface antigen BspA-like [Trichomonas vaginalis G3]
MFQFNVSLINVEIKSSYSKIPSFCFYNYENLESVLKQYAFYKCTKLKSFTFPDGLKSIEDCSFSECASLSTVSLPNSVEQISGFPENTVFNYDGNNFYPLVYMFLGNDTVREIQPDKIILTTNKEMSFVHTGEEGNIFAEKKNSLQVLNFPSFVTKIVNYAFRSAHIYYLTFPESLLYIGDCAFQGCTDIEKVIIPDSVTCISIWGFYRMENLKEVIIGENVKYLGAGTFQSCIRLSKIVNKASIEELRSNVFSGCAIESFEITSSVKSIARNAFSYCTNLKSITIGENVEFIGEHAFSECISLNAVTIPGNIIYVDISAFPSNTRITFENPLRSIAVIYKYRSGDSIKEILPNKIILNDGSNIDHDGSIDRVERNEFEYKNSLIKVHFPPSLKYIYGSGFHDCPNLKEVIFESADVRYDPRDSFLNCPVTIKYNNVGNIILPYQYADSNQTGEITTSFKLSPYSFHSSKFTSITIEQGLKSIPDYCFGFCLNLTRINLPDSIETIGANAFCFCLNRNYR